MSSWNIGLTAVAFLALIAACSTRNEGNGKGSPDGAADADAAKNAETAPDLSDATTSPEPVEAGDTPLSGEADSARVNTCIPQCEGKCGPNECGTTCPNDCDDNDPCTYDFCNYIFCDYAVTDSCCDIDGLHYPAGWGTPPSNPCRYCDPAIFRHMWIELPDGAECGPNQECVDGECCDWHDSCAGRECGEGLCGSCGNCPIEAPLCIEFKCHASACDQRQCGSDDWGVTCGWCPGWSLCTEGDLCLTACTQACAGRECGPDGCGGFCGECETGYECTDDGKCVDKCIKSCSGNACGQDGCGGSCGQCPARQYCQAGLCSNTCAPGCILRLCGDDGCGGSCGECPDELACTIGGTCGSFCAQCSVHPLYCDRITFAEGSLAQWTATPGATVVEHLGSYEAETGGHMLQLRPPSGDTGVLAEFQDCLPPGNHTIDIRWRFFSAEFKEWCGSNYQDGFRVWLFSRGQDPVAVYSATVDELCPPEECPECGMKFVGLEFSTFVFDAGGIWGTPWVSSSAAFTLPPGDGQFTVQIAAWDVGSLLPLLLVDRFGFDGAGM